MKHILFLMGRHLPVPSANSICCENIIQVLLNKGYKVTCLAYYDGGEYELNPAPNYRIIKVNRGKMYRLEITQSCDRFLKLIIKMYNRTRVILSLYRWPWQDPLYTKRLYQSAEKLYESDPFSVVVAVHMPISSLIVGNRLKRRHPDIQYIPYFLDSLSGGYCPRYFSKDWLVIRGLIWERKLLPNANSIIMMESSKQHHEKYSIYESYYKNVQYLDLPLFKIRKNSNAFQYHQAVTLVYVGSLSLGVRSPEYILNVFKQIKNDNWRFIFIGEDNCKLLNQYAKSDKRIIVVGKCAHEKALEYEAQADVLVNIGNKNSNMTPSKLFEYMSWLKKIVSVAPIENEPCIPYLKKYPCSLQLYEKIDNYKYAAEKLIKFVKAPVIVCQGEELLKTFRENTPEAFVREVIEREE